ncbi:hypothetical protein Tco_0298728 [Tanacetum coccineum]
MDPSSSIGKTCLRENVIEISSDKAKGHGDWNSLEFLDTTNSGGKKETKAMVFHKMDTEEVSDRYVSPCFVNGLEAYDGEINLREDDIEPGVVLGRSFLRLTKAIADFETVTIKIYPELDPFLESYEEEEKIRDDWDLLLDNLDFEDMPDIEGVSVSQLVCKMGKSSKNKRKQLENYKLTYSDMGPSMSTGKPLTQAEAEREVLAISICERYSLLEEERPVIETIAYSDKYKKILDRIYLDKMKLDGMDKEEEEAIIKIKGESLIEKDDPGAFVIPIQLEGKINLNALAKTGSDINTMPYHIYKELGREDVQNVKEITMLNHSKAKPMGLLRDVLYTPILMGRGFLYTCGGILNMIERIKSTFDGTCHQTFHAAQTSLDTIESDSDDKEEYVSSFIRSVESVQKDLCLEESSLFSGIVACCIEVIENSNAPPITKVVEGVETTIAPTIAEEKAQRRFGGNAATKKIQRNLLKQQYENFIASSSEVLDQTFDRLQKLISQLEIHGESIS